MTKRDKLMEATRNKTVRLSILLLLLTTVLSGFGQLRLTPGTKLKVDSATFLKLKNGMKSDSANITNKGIIDLYGNLINNGLPLFTSASDSGEFWFSDWNEQQISGNTDVTFRGHVYVKNPDVIALSSLATGTDQSIYGILSIDTGRIKLNTFDLFVDSITPDGYSTYNYIWTNWSGSLERQVPADGTTDVIYPVGRNHYNPVILKNSATATSDIYGVSVLGEEPADDNTEGFVDMSWVVTEQTPGGSDLTVTPQWIAFDELTGFDRNNSAVGRTTDSGATYEWALFGAAAGSDPYTRTGSGFASVGTFGVADSAAAFPSPTVLPFFEPWESNNGVKNTNGLIYSGANYSWSFETDKPGEGEANYGTEAYKTYNGSGALTLDKFPSNGTYATNSAILTLDLSGYAFSTSLSLTFWWADHADEEQPEDKVFVRGSSSDQWVEIYDLDPVAAPNHVYQVVAGLDIDAVLAAASQTVSSTFQVKFQQKDNSFAPGDGISFDDILIEETGCKTPSQVYACNILSNQADLNWTENNGAGMWEIMLDTAGFDTTGYALVTVNSNPYTWTSLQASTLYDFYLRATCGGDSYSQWTGPFQFLTAPGPLSPATLPFSEDWESNSGSGNSSSNLYAASTYYWDFLTSLQGEGYINWGSNAFLPHQGNGALSMDKYPSSNEEALNAAILTIDLSAYTASTNLELSFWWTDHNDENQEGDKVWIRGSDCDEWVEVVSLNPKAVTDGVYQYVSGIDIDQALASASPPQSPSGSFQLKLGQQDNSYYPGDGISYDDIMITEGQSIPAVLPFIEDFESADGFRNTDGDMFAGMSHYWDFATSIQGEGFGRWGNEAWQVNNGQGALTMDKYPSNGTYATNQSIMTLDLSNYTSSTNLELSFWWADHADEEHPEDKVYIRGSNSDAWIEIYDLDPAVAPNHTYQQVAGIDIDAALAAVSQTVSATFQLKFVQKDNSFTPGDGMSFDDIVIDEAGPAPAVLPFFEDWESNSGELKNNGNAYVGAGYSWDYENDNPNEGRFRFGTYSYQPYNGSGAMTMDKFPNDGDFATNYVILTIDLSNYNASTDLELSFWWTDHKDEEQTQDKVWIRGNDGDSWLEIYDLDPVSNTDHVYTQVSGLDIDATLAAASQAVSSTFQVRFGQKDNSFTATAGDGLSFDDIAIVDNSPPGPTTQPLGTGPGMEVTASTIEAQPNPFNDETRLIIYLEKAQQTKIAVYDLNGQLIDILHDGFLENGDHMIKWESTSIDGRDVKNGMYIVKMVTASFVMHKTIIKL